VGRFKRTKNRKEKAKGMRGLGVEINQKEKKVVTEMDSFSRERERGKHLRNSHQCGIEGESEKKEQREVGGMKSKFQ